MAGRPVPCGAVAGAWAASLPLGGLGLGRDWASCRAKVEWHVKGRVGEGEVAAGD